MGLRYGELGMFLFCALLCGYSVALVADEDLPTFMFGEGDDISLRTPFLTDGAGVRTSVRSGRVWVAWILGCGRKDRWGYVDLFTISCEIGLNDSVLWLTSIFLTRCYLRLSS